MSSSDDSTPPRRPMTPIERGFADIAQSHDRHTQALHHHTQALERHTDAIHGLKRLLSAVEGRIAGVEQGLGEVTSETADRVLIVLANLEKQRTTALAKTGGEGAGGVAIESTKPDKKKGDKTDKFALIDGEGTEHLAMSGAARAKLYAVVKWMVLIGIPTMLGWLAKMVHNELTTRH
jgi:hypothetical protein